MFYLREDDMDELLRKAAEDYEIDVDRAANWEGVQRSVHEGSAPVTVARRKKRRFMFWWLLLIPVGWFGHYKWNELHKAQTTKAVANQPSGVPKEQPSIPFQDNVTKEKQPSQNNKGYHDAKRQNLSQQTLIRDKNNKTPADHFSSKNEVSQVLNPEGNITGDQSQERNTNAQLQTLNNDQKPGNDQETVNNEQYRILPRQNPSLTDVLVDDVQTNKTNTNGTVSSSNNKKTNSHYFYAGIIAGPDISFIEFQKAQSLGLNAGLIAGYRLNKFSIESGLIYARKNYYTSGEYFDKTGIPYFNDAEIIAVDGYCHMFEIPLNVRYTFGERKKHSWFASAGFSSYLMKKEYYNFSYVKNDSTYHGGYPYYNSVRNWFSIINLSAGYELKTGDKTNLRIEPYYKIPATGVGTGNLSISSAGINIGITRKIP